MKVYAKTFAQRSGAKVLLAGLVGVLIGFIPEVIGVIEFSPPWDRLVPIFVGFVVALLKLLQEYLSEPSVAARDLPTTFSVERKR